MTSSNRKYFFIPIGIALALIGAFELGYQYLCHPNFWQKTTWLLHDPYRSELFDRVVVYEKLTRLDNAAPDIISIGDSSGFFSIQPTIVNRYLRGLKYINLSTGANQGFAGYEGIMDFYLEQHPSVKYVVMNLYPNLLPSPQVFRVSDLAPILYSNLVGTKSWMTPPSAGLSPRMKHYFFYKKPFHANDLLSGHKVYVEMHQVIDETLGWMPEHDVRFNRTTQPTPLYEDIDRHTGNLYGIFDRSAILVTLNRFAEKCRKRGVRFYIMFNPMPWGAIVADENLAIAEKRLEEFQAQNPDVVFLSPLITPWDPSKFGMFNHVARDYVFESSARMGMALAQAIYNPASIKPFKENWKPQKFATPSNIQALGTASEEEKGAALAYYLYAATADEHYKDQISNRVLGLLANSQPFDWMMDDTRARLKNLAAKQIALTYDVSKLKAEIVSLTEGYYCGDSNDVTWIRLSGTIGFGYESPEQKMVEPVNWPESSNILIPIIKENGHFKFDGYNPAPM